MFASSIYAMDSQAPTRAFTASPATSNTAPYSVEQLARLIPKVAIIHASVQILKDYDNIFKSDITIKEAVFKIGIFACVGATLELCFDGIPYCVKKIPSGLMYGTERFMTGIYRICGLPTPIAEDRLMHHSVMFEDIINTLTKQQASGGVMLRNMRVEQDTTIVNDQRDQWTYYVSFVVHRLEHISLYLRDSLRYYRDSEGTKGWWQKASERFSPDTIPDTVCTIDEIIANINHIMRCMKAAPTQDDLDTNHLKMLSVNTKTLFKELKILVMGMRKQDGQPATLGS